MFEVIEELLVWAVPVTPILKISCQGRWRWQAVELALAAPGRDSGSFKPGGFGVAYVNNGTLR